MRKILVTGASGFIGRLLIPALTVCESTLVEVVVRHKLPDLPNNIVQHVISDIGPNTKWKNLLNDISDVIHLAAAIPLSVPCNADTSIYYRVNLEATLQLAQQSLDAGVKRFIFISSIGVNGEISKKEFTPFDMPAPHDHYSKSKCEAEQELRQLLTGSTMEWVIIRPPSVYGPHVRGKFNHLLLAVSKGLPLPLGAVHNRRSLVAIGNLVDLIGVCVRHPHAAGQVFLVSDGEDVSTTELLKRIARALGKPSRLLPFPVWSLTLAASLLGKGAAARRLYGNLQVDISYTCETLDWHPPVTVDQALKETAGAYLAEQSTRSGVGGSSRLLRLFDVVLALLGLIAGSPVLLALMVLGYFDTGSPLFRQVRVGRGKRPFTLVKFRTMRRGTASVASHLADAAAVTPLGRFMRRAKLDELPQLWNVLKGEMSLVGPRPGLYNQHQLTAERDKLDVYRARPGITGLAQVNNIDMSTPALLAQTDHDMLRSLSASTYFKYIIRTVTGNGSGDAVRNS